MKSILIILSFYILGMAVVPCSGIAFEEDEIECCADHCSNDHEQEDDNDGCKVCNPFFSCTCYSAGIIFSQTAFLLTETPVVPVVKNTVYFSPDYIELSYSVWQPPKLSV